MTDQIPIPLKAGGIELPPTALSPILLPKSPKKFTLPESLFPKDFPIPQLTEHPLNIVTLPQDQRTQLLLGPKINIVPDDNIAIRTRVPVRALMASLGRVHDLIRIKPYLSDFRVYGNLERESLERLLDVFTTTDILDAKTITLATGDFAKDVAVYQACLALAVHYTHAKVLLNTLRKQISTGKLSFEEMEAVIYRIPATDPLFKHLANDLCHRRFKKEIEDVYAFEKWLGKSSKTKLQNAMTEIDQGHKRKREVFKATQGGKDEDGKQVKGDSDALWKFIEERRRCSV